MDNNQLMDMWLGLSFIWIPVILSFVINNINEKKFKSFSNIIVLLIYTINWILYIIVKISI